MKTNTLTKSILGLALASTLGLSSVQAVELDDFYLGASVVQSYVDERGLDDDTTGGKIFGGYKINQYLAIEASYYDFDTIEDRASNFEVDGYGLGVVGTYPVTDKISVFAKAGAHNWDARANGQISNLLSRDSDTDAFYGVGAKYKLTDNVSFQAEIERYEIDDIDLDAASLGVTFNF